MSGLGVLPGWRGVGGFSTPHSAWDGPQTQNSSSFNAHSGRLRSPVLSFWAARHTAPRAGWMALDPQ